MMRSPKRSPRGRARDSVAARYAPLQPLASGNSGCVRSRFRTCSLSLVATPASWPSSPGRYDKRHLYAVELALVRVHSGETVGETRSLSVATSLGPNKAIAMACAELHRLVRL